MACPCPIAASCCILRNGRALADRLRHLGVQFVIEPCTRFKGQVGEQSTMFFRDPSGNALEFKAFSDFRQLFATAAHPERAAGR